jgi:hypothetical protein
MRVATRGEEGLKMSFLLPLTQQDGICVEIYRVAVVKHITLFRLSLAVTSLCKELHVVAST